MENKKFKEETITHEDEHTIITEDENVTKWYFKKDGKVIDDIFLEIICEFPIKKIDEISKKRKINQNKNKRSN